MTGGIKLYSSLQVFVTIYFAQALAQTCSYKRDSYSAKWTYDPSTQRVTFDISAVAHVTSGPNFWTGIGFGKDMTDLDVYFVAVMRNRVATADSYTTGYGVPVQDDDGGQETTVLKRTLEDGVLNVVFSRPLRATHPQQDKSLTGCQTYQFPYTGGPIDGSRIHKHVGPPEARLVCNIDTKCVLRASAPELVQLEPKEEKEDGLGDAVLASKDALSPVVNADCTFEDSETGYKVVWVSDGAKLDFVLTSPAVLGAGNNYWVGIGFGKTMADLDIVLTKVEDNEVTSIEDYYSQKYGAPKRDQIQDVEDAFGEVINNKVVVQFSRALETGDAKDKPLSGCPTFQFVVSGGALQQNGQIGKHAATPIARQYCDVAVRCLAGGGGAVSPPSNRVGGEAGHAQVDPVQGGLDLGAGGGEAAAGGDASGGGKVDEGAVPATNGVDSHSSTFTASTSSPPAATTVTTTPPVVETATLPTTAAQTQASTPATPSPPVATTFSAVATASPPIATPSPGPDPPTVLQTESTTSPTPRASSASRTSAADGSRAAAASTNTLPDAMESLACSDTQQDIAICTPYFGEYFTRVDAWANLHSIPPTSQYKRACDHLYKVPNLVRACCKTFAAKCASYDKYPNP